MMMRFWNLTSNRAKRVAFRNNNMTGFTYDELNFQDFCDVNKDILHSSGDVIL